MKKRTWTTWLAGLCAVMVVLVLAACGSTPTETDADAPAEAKTSYAVLQKMALDSDAYKLTYTATLDDKGSATKIVSEETATQDGATAANTVTYDYTYDDDGYPTEFSQTFDNTTFGGSASHEIAKDGDNTVTTVTYKLNDNDKGLNADGNNTTWTELTVKYTVDGSDNLVALERSATAPVIDDTVQITTATTEVDSQGRPTSYKLTMAENNGDPKTMTECTIAYSGDTMTVTTTVDDSETLQTPDVQTYTLKLDGAEYPSEIALTDAGDYSNANLSATFEYKTVEDPTELVAAVALADPYITFLGF